MKKHEEREQRRMKDEEEGIAKGKGKQKGEDKGKAGGREKQGAEEQPQVQQEGAHRGATVSIGVGNTPEAAREMMDAENEEQDEEDDEEYYHDDLYSVMDVLESSEAREYVREHPFFIQRAYTYDGAVSIAMALTLTI